jgi:hypothetical protein
MDDVNLIRTVLLDDGGEGEDARAAGRLRLQRAVVAERAGGVPARRWRRWTLAGSGLVAAAAAAALVVGLGAQPDPAPPAGSHVAAAPPTAQEFLLAAATSAAVAPATSGKYWHTRWDMHIAAGVKSPAPGNPVQLGPEHVQVVEEWQAAKPGEQNWSSSGRVQDGVYRPEVTKTDRIGYGWETEFSPAEVRVMPTDPVGLRAVLTAKQNKLRYDLPPLDTYLFKATVGLLARAPASPAQMAAGYRLLARLPGVELAGTATDSEGRTGLLLRHRGEKGTDEVIVDRESYQVLAEKSSEPRRSSLTVVFKAREWTDAEPTR